MIFTASKCKSSWLHRFKIIAQYPEGVQERCEICHKKVFLRVINGKSNNTRYIASHMRQVLVPQHRLFIHEYPNSKPWNKVVSPYQ